ncbi:MAG: hypothetical protein ACR2RA_08560, partial [Geminicoccaceae bacterium]
MAFFGLALLLAACSSDRPKGAICKGFCPRPDGPVTLGRAKGGDQAEAPESTATSVMASEELGEQLRDLMLAKAETVPIGVPERALADLPDADDGRLH